MGKLSSTNLKQLWKKQTILFLSVLINILGYDGCFHENIIDALLDKAYGITYVTSDQSLYCTYEETLTLSLPFEHLEKTDQTDRLSECVVFCVTSLSCS